jgi:3-carboxy-cis,cis-muconate cycloisomerase
VFDAIFAPQDLLDELGDRAWLQAMLDSERALAQAEAAAGLIPAEAVEAIAAACRADLYDRERIGRDGRGSGNPAEPLVRALRSAVGGEAAGYVHYGATSQDIVDTAAMLVSRRALELVLVDVAHVTSACAALAERHRATPMVARTLLQQALPTTFGIKAATWLVGVLEARGLVLDARDRLAVQLGGAAGTLAALGDDGPGVAGPVGSARGRGGPGGRSPDGERARPGGAGRSLAHVARARRGPRVRPRDPGRCARQDRAGRRAAGADRGR